MILKSRSNKRQSTVIISLLLFCYFNNISLTVVKYFELGYISVLIALIFSVTSAYVSYYNSDKIILSMNGARQLINKKIDF